jgi:hypothetical protein
VIQRVRRQHAASNIKSRKRKQSREDQSVYSRWMKV